MANPGLTGSISRLAPPGLVGATGPSCLRRHKCRHHRRRPNHPGGLAPSAPAEPSYADRRKPPQPTQPGGPTQPAPVASSDTGRTIGPGRTSQAGRHGRPRLTSAKRAVTSARTGSGEAGRHHRPQLAPARTAATVGSDWLRREGRSPPQFQAAWAGACQAGYSLSVTWSPHWAVEPVSSASWMAMCVM